MVLAMFILWLPGNDFRLNLTQCPPPTLPTPHLGRPRQAGRQAELPPQGRAEQTLCPLPGGCAGGPTCQGRAVASSRYDAEW